MTLSLAPMEGITTHVFRRALHLVYGGVDIFFTPFIAAAHTNVRERRDLLPENNPGMRLIPQMLTDSPEDFSALSHEILSMGYTEINLNLGCPSRTVVRGGRGAGFLSRVGELRHFLDRVFTLTPMKVSAKTRIGYASPDEWDALMEIYRCFPFTSLTVHPRTGVMMYSGQAEPSYVKKAAQQLPFPVIYNGDIRTPEDFRRVTAFFSPGTSGAAPSNEAAESSSPVGSSSPEEFTSPAESSSAPERSVTRFMIGRGLIADPSLGACIRLSRADQPNRADARQDASAFSRFHQLLFDGYGEEGLPRRKHLDKMKELWTYFLSAQPVSADTRRRLFSAMTYPEYEAAVRMLLSETTFG